MKLEICIVQYIQDLRCGLPALGNSELAKLEQYGRFKNFGQKKFLSSLCKSIE